MRELLAELAFALFALVGVVDNELALIGGDEWLPDGVVLVLRKSIATGGNVGGELPGVSIMKRR